MMNPPCERICFGQPDGAQVCVRYTLDHHSRETAIVRRPIPARNSDGTSGAIVWNPILGQWHFRPLVGRWGYNR